MQPSLDFGIPLPSADTIVTIGTFDGVHRGHLHLIGQVIQWARATGRLAIGLTFTPHPRTILRPELPMAYLSTSQERVERLCAAGFDKVVVANFTPSLAGTTAAAFMEALVQQLRMRELWVGHDFTLGRAREGSVDKLKAIGAALGCEVHVVEPLLKGGKPINSTRIRNLITAGEVQQAALLLGRRYSLAGQVIPGRQVGRQLGIRTANIACDPERIIPANGVYAAWADVGSERCMAAVNIGIRPSFGPSERLLEVHILDYEGNLYNAELCVTFVQRLRAEQRFEDPAALVAQVQRDIAATRSVLSADDCQERTAHG